MQELQIKTQDLCELIEPDNIRSKLSLQKLGSWGGLTTLERYLKTNYKTGIPNDKTDNDQRRAQYGDNQPIVKPPKTIFQFIKQNFQDEMLRVLCIAAAVSLILGILTQGLAQGWLEGASILVAVVIIVTVTAGNNYFKQKQFQKLNSIATAKNVDVYRNGSLTNISVYQLLVGDIVQIQTGQILSVDGILIEAHDISLDQSSITGQTNSVKKNVPVTYEKTQKCDPFLISGSMVIQGTGTMVVIAVGKLSYYGKLKLKIQSSDDQTPLQQKLSILAQQIGNVGMVSAAFTFAAMFIHYIYDCAVSDDFLGQLISMETITEIVEYFIIAVSIIVVAVPQGLPLAVTIALAYSVGKMKQQNNLVRYLQACQTMGGANNICSDKTGTLTKNLMTVTKMFVQQNQTDIIDKDKMTQQTCRLMCISICNNSNANPMVKTIGAGRAQFKQLGNKTQCALLQMAYKLHYDFRKMRSKQKILRIFPFSSQKKKMATIFKDQHHKRYAFVKGAPDYLFASCNSYVNRQGKVAIIGEEFTHLLKEKITLFAKQSLRTILIAYKQIEAVPQSFEQVDCNLTILGMVGIKDPLRDGIKESVQKCFEAGVKVRMITGDNIDTAIAIAKQAGILNQNWQPKENDYTVMEGKQFRQFVGGIIDQGQQNQRVGNLQNFKLIQRQLCVLARSSPHDKYLMATGLKSLDNVVAMTGDGTNDAPALKKADIGFAMGLSGTQVAKQASGIILLDDNFSSIVTAMKWGRNIFDCIRKFLQFQLTVNFVALVMAFVGGAVLRESPLNPIQMLWVNLIMDTLASLALATQPPSDELLKRKPYSRYQSLITANMWKNIISQGIWQIIILGTILFKGPQILGIPSSIGVKDWNEDTGKHYSIFFNVFVLLQIFNEINARKLKHSEANVFENFFNNPLFLVILVGTIVIQITMVEYGGKSLKTVKLSLIENLLCLSLAATGLLSSLLTKIILPQHLIISLSGLQIGSFKYYWKKVQKENKEE